MSIPLELLHSERVLRQVKIYKAGRHKIEGLSTYHSRCWGLEGLQDYTVHFVIEFDRPIKKFGVWQNDEVRSVTKYFKAGVVEDAVRLWSLTRAGIPRTLELTIIDA